METIYTERSDVVSDDEKLMTEKVCTYLEETYEWKRELISKEKFKKVYKHTTPKGKVIYTYIAMRSSQYKNIFINEDIYNKYKDSDIDLFIVMADKRKRISPKYVWMSEIRKIKLRHTTGETGGYLVPDVLFHKFTPREIQKC